MSRRTLSNRSWRRPLSLLVVFSFLAGLVFPVMGSPAPVAAKPLAPQAKVIATYDFEDATMQGWYGRGATAEVVTGTAHLGTHSVAVTGRTSDWNGAAINLIDLLEVGATYEISGCIRLAEGMTTTRTNFGLEYQYPDVVNPYPWLGSNSATTDSEWACMVGTFEYTVEATTLTLNAEAADPNVSFYIDDVSIVMTAPPPIMVLAEYDFEDATMQDWYGRGATAEVVTGTAHLGTHSLAVTGRTSDWNGAAVNLIDLLEVGYTYEITGCIRLAEGMTTTRTNFGLEYQYPDVVNPYPWLGSNSATTDSEWACMMGSFEYAIPATTLTLNAEAADPNVSFYIDDIVIYQITQPPIQTDIPSVYETYADYFLVGAELETDGIESARHDQLLTRHFNSITAGNAMKPGPIHPYTDTYNFAIADAVADYARDNDLPIHGHTLVWHSQAANWMFQDDEGNPLEATPANKELVLDRMEDHIRTVVGRYNDVVNVWDVVNEVVDVSGDNCYRESEWYRLTGPDYITKAFQIAREEAPTATLILNDYGETEPAKRECIYNLVANLQAQGVPVDGIGMQMHINIQNPSVSAISETIAIYGQLGEVHITELDMSVYTSDSDSYDVVPQDILITQGYRYADIFKVLRAHGGPSGVLKSVTFWGMADDRTWLSHYPVDRINLPLLFDKNLQAKYAYWGVINPEMLPVNIQEQVVFNATPVLDGVIDHLWTFTPWTEIAAMGTSISATFQTRWDQDYLYLIVDVVDATDDEEDKVEVFVDQNDGNTASYQGDDLHYTFPSQTNQLNYVIITNTHGYQLEARFPLTVEFAIGTRIGFDVRVTDGSNPTPPISWNDLKHTQNTNTAQFGTLVLVDEMRQTTAIEGTPDIDAVEDELWADATAISTDVWVNGTSGATATVKTMWDSNHLYAFAVVSDALLSKASTDAYQQDSIELFLDQNNAKTTDYQADDGQFRINFDNEVSFRGTAASTATLASMAMTTTWGYVVELAITLTDVLPQEGGIIGFDFQVNDDATGAGSRTSVVTWNDPTGQSYQNTSRLGVLEFVERPEPDFFVVYLPLILRGSD